ncbi:hypothetical protein MNBD_DELTA01-1098 [hydrothermal vent metagenome]|uniref:DUF445 domain-containing protein n=1 Tax=hydrothermal vent metagenome TaxID=652676 RepID=A0A3B0QSX0_9ZZZZ
MSTLYIFLVPPIVGAAIGWLTNYVAIKLLFRPHYPTKVLGLTFQGLIPKRRKEISRSIAKVIEKELLNSKDLASALDGMDLKEEVEQIVENVVEHRIKPAKIKKIPLVGLVSDNLTTHLKYFLSKEILLHLDKKKSAFAKNFSNKLNVKELLASRIDNLDVHKFEGLLTEFIARELKHIEKLGGIIGFFIGLVQSFVFYFLF